MRNLIHFRNTIHRIGNRRKSKFAIVTSNANIIKIVINQEIIGISDARKIGINQKDK